MRQETPAEIFQDLTEQFDKDFSLVSGMKENPRKAIIRELSVFWNFSNQLLNLNDQPSLFSAN